MKTKSILIFYLLLLALFSCSSENNDAVDPPISPKTKSCLTKSIKYSNGIESKHNYNEESQLIQTEWFNKEGEKTSTQNYIYSEGRVVCNNFDNDGNKTRTSSYDILQNNQIQFFLKQGEETVREFYKYDDNKYLIERNTEQVIRIFDLLSGTIVDSFIDNITYTYKDGNLIEVKTNRLHRSEVDPVGPEPNKVTLEESKTDYVEYEYDTSLINKQVEPEVLVALGYNTPNKNLPIKIIYKDENNVVTGSADISYELDENGYITSETHTQDDSNGIVAYKYNCITAEDS
ncbi:hypothetical protein [Flavivirga eckloniae]|uniref:DUF4595 domain-containing protein n=1 Tax=Flavivirga eckloniae TaxID=1803846 RepID=A0A2K9PNB7_9FLAO|nr:hypothetical protein [Flavivirga eckloniae]AUP78549.1 hypothetical protein C1H87_07420 [Flavivirga eckloniae]